MTDTPHTPNGHSNDPIPFDERARRVLELKRQVKAGLYRPDPRDVTRAILTHWFELGLELERETTASVAAGPTDARDFASHFLVEKTAAAAQEEETTRTA
jgi:hypothetical protein